MKRTLFLVLAALSAFGADDTGRIQRGDLLKRHDYKTFATLTLYVDPTGNDANSCLAVTTSACLTIQGALNKVPKLLQNGVIINVAAGNYAGATISGFTIDPSVSKTTAGILLDGALSNVTPTTGSATGTATAGSSGAAATATFSTMTDGAATWTVNDAAMVGKFLVFTGGTGSGQVRVICSNTATVITLCGTGTAATGSTTYAIQSPSVNITSAAALIPKPQTGTETSAAGLQVLDNVTGGSRITLRNIGISIAATSGLIAANTGTVEAIQVTTSTTTGTAFTASGNSALTATTCSAFGTSLTGFSAATPGTALSVATSLVSGTAGGTGVAASNGAVLSNFTGKVNSVTVGVLISLSSGSAFTGALQCDCASISSSICLRAGTSLATASTNWASMNGTVNVSGGVGVTNCTTGLSAAGNSTVMVGSTVVISGNALGAAVAAIHGGQIVLPTATTTITGATAETSIDNGVATATFASYAASFDCLTSLATGSKVCRQ